jgi:hypothetical protein
MILRSSCRPFVFELDEGCDDERSTPFTDFRDRLAAARAAGIDFDRAWATGIVDVPDDLRGVLEATATAWRCGWAGQTYVRPLPTIPRLSPESSHSNGKQSSGGKRHGRKAQRSKAVAV